MDDKYCCLTVNHKGKDTSYFIRRGLGFQAVSARNPLPIEYDCRDADCGICAFRIVSGEASLSPALEKEADFLRAMRADPDERLACQCRILGDLKINVDT